MKMLQASLNNHAAGAPCWALPNSAMQEDTVVTRMLIGTFSDWNCVTRIIIVVRTVLAPKFPPQTSSSAPHSFGLAGSSFPKEGELRSCGNQGGRHQKWNLCARLCTCMLKCIRTHVWVRVIMSTERPVADTLYLFPLSLHQHRDETSELERLQRQFGIAWRNFLV